MDENMHSMIQCLTDMEKCVAEMCKAELAKGVSGIDSPQELNYAFDWLKDIADAKKNCLEAKYYKTVIEAMEEGSEEDHERFGYNNRSYASGRYAPSGHGHISGYRSGKRGGIYKPGVDQYPYIMDYLDDPNYGENMMQNHRMGYDPNWSPSHTNGQSGSNSNYGYYPNMADEEMRYGKPYHEYRAAKRHYESAGSNKNDQDLMDSKSYEHVNNFATSVREMWKTATPETKSTMKSTLTALMNELKT